MYKEINIGWLGDYFWLSSSQKGSYFYSEIIFSERKRWSFKHDMIREKALEVEGMSANILRQECSRGIQGRLGLVGAIGEGERRPQATGASRDELIFIMVEEFGLTLEWWGPLGFKGREWHDLFYFSSTLTTVWRIVEEIVKE